MLRRWLGLTRQEWRTFRTRNLDVIVYFISNNSFVKERYLRKWWFLKRFLKQHKHIRMLEKISLFFTRKVSVPTMDFNITTRCTLKCRDCGSLMPLYTKAQHYDETLESFKCRLDALLENVRCIYEFKIIGGEPLLNADFAEMVDYACSKKQILFISIVTNGTIIPSQKILDTFMRNSHRIAVFISNYTLHNKTKYSQVLDILEKHKIPYYSVRNASDFTWIKRGDIYARNRGIEGIKRTFWRCWQKDCVSLFEGRFLVCTRAYWIEKALNPTINLLEGINLNYNTANGGGGECLVAK